MAESVYAPLERDLASRKADRVKMTFSEIEAVLGRALPPSARDLRPWWSNTSREKVQTKAWRRAGYKALEIDMASETVVFEKSSEPFGDGPSQAAGIGAAAGLAEAQAAYTTKKRVTLDDVYGCMKGTITVAPGVDLTEPVAKDFWETFDEKWDEKLPL